MSYRAGLDHTVARLIGVDPGPPRVTCDRCGVRYSIREDRMPPKWLLTNKAPPGWKLIRNPDGTRQDYCGRCRGAAP